MASERAKSSATGASSEVLGALRRITQTLDLRSRRLALRYQVTLPQLLCLIASVGEEGLTSRQAAARIHLSASTMVGILDRLELKGLIRRERDTTDRRVVFIRPTEKGRELVEKVPSPLGRNFLNSFKRLSRSKQRTLADSVEFLADLMESSGVTPDEEQR